MHTCEPVMAPVLDSWGDPATPIIIPDMQASFQGPLLPQLIHSFIRVFHKAHWSQAQGGVQTGLRDGRVLLPLQKLTGGGGHKRGP